MLNGTRARSWSAWAFAGLLVASTACNDFLVARNPGAIEEANVNSAAYAGLLVNGVIGEFQPAFSSTALYSAVFTDELANFHGYVDNVEIDRRAADLNNGTVNGQVFTPLQSARFMADTVASLLRAMLGDSASRDLGVARSLALGGYTYALLGEQFCEAPVNRSKAFTSSDLLGFALTRLQNAATVAKAAATYYSGLGTAGAAKVKSADSLRILAQIGAARVSLDLGDPTGAATLASAIVNDATIPDGWGFRVYHSANSAREYNPFFAAASGGASAEWVAITNTPYATVTGDPRIPHPTTTERTQQGDAIVPNSPLMFSTYNGTAVGADFARDASIQFASKLEARYILAEAQGPTPSNVTFINSRRAIAGQPALVAPTATAFRSALIEQRARDLYLTGYRLGDLRRYEKLYALDLWQTGAYASPVPAPPTFGDKKCWPIPAAEYAGNPNLPRP